MCYHINPIASVITGSPTHSAGVRLLTVAGVCRRLSSVGVCNTRICNVTRQEAAGDCGPVVLRSVRATRCFDVNLMRWRSWSKVHGVSMTVVQLRAYVQHWSCGTTVSGECSALHRRSAARRQNATGSTSTTRHYTSMSRRSDAMVPSTVIIHPSTEDETTSRYVCLSVCVLYNRRLYIRLFTVEPFLSAVQRRRHLLE